MNKEIYDKAILAYENEKLNLKRKKTRTLSEDHRLQTVNEILSVLHQVRG